MIARVALKERIVGGGNYFATPPTDVQFTRSGSKLLDLALGGGWAEGRVINIVGDMSAGKTLLCIEAAANFANRYPKSRIRYREVESAFQKSYAGALGMPLDHVDFGDPLYTVEDLFKDLKHLSNRARRPELVIVDSLDALSDSAELERDFGEGSYGAQKAKDLSKMFRMLIQDLSEHITLIVVSQTRDKIGVTFGKKWSRSGGRALDYYASQIPYLAHLGTVKQRYKGIERTTGVTIRARITKNKVGLPYREAEFNILFGFGIDDVTSCLKWLDDVKALNEFGIAKDKIATYSRELMKAPDKEYHATTKRLHALVTRRWNEIETTFLPTRSKYGNGAGSME
jgi:recombination protein RecA